MPAPRASVHTLGCRLNQSEGQLLRERLQEMGYEIVPFGEPADLGILNTCTVTQQAESKCRQALRGFLRANPQAFTAVVGCYSQTGAKALARIPGVDLIVGNEDKMSVLAHAGLGKNETPVILRERISREDFTVTFAGDIPFDQRANLKVQDGCSFGCSFCIIPQARGPARSRELGNLLEEARAMVRRGIREIVLTGVNIGTYHSGGCDIAGVCDLLDELRAEGLWRLRISSIEPTTIPESLLERMADPGHVLLPYLHIPLQSGCDRVLAAMRRRYTTAEYARFLALAVERVPGLCLGTDILVGFPGETGEEFAETCAFFDEQPFAYTHVFTYSERPGTPAARSMQPVPVPERDRRGAVLRRMSARKRRAYYGAHLGREMEVLLENPREDSWPGLTANYIRVVCPEEGAAARSGTADRRNRLARVRLQSVEADFVEGRLVEMLT